MSEQDEFTTYQTGKTIFWILAALGGFFLTLFAIADILGLTTIALAAVMGNPLNGRPRLWAALLIVGVWGGLGLLHYLQRKLERRFSDRDVALRAGLKNAHEDLERYRNARSRLGGTDVSLPDLDIDSADFELVDDRISKGRFRLAAEALDEIKTEIDEGREALSDAARRAKSEYERTRETAIDRLAAATDRTDTAVREGPLADTAPDSPPNVGSGTAVDPDTAVDAIETYREARAETCLAAAEDLRSKLSEPETPEDAQTALRAASEALDDADFGRATDRAEAAFGMLLEAYGEASRNRAKERIESLVDSAATAREEGDEAYDAEDYERAREAYSGAREDYQEALDLADDHDLDVDHDVRDSLSDVNEWHGYATLATAADRVADAESEIGSDPDAAIEAFDDAATFLKSASLPDEGTFEDRKEELYDRIDRGRFRAEIERERDRMEAAERAHADGDPSAAKSRYEGCREAISDIRDRLAVATVSIDSDLDRLESVCADNAEALDRELAGVVATADLRSVEPDEGVTADSSADGEREDGSSETTATERGPAETATPSRVRGDSEGSAATATPSQTVSDSLRGALPDHDVIEWIGSGGNADVHKIRLTDSGAVAALKVPRWEGTLSASRYEEFTNEAEMWAKLDAHDNIVDVLDWGTDPYPWLVLEYVDGSLADRLSDGEHFEPTAAVDVASGIADALEYAHGNGVVHLDVKPENILLDGDTPKVADWGLARLVLEFTRTEMGLTPAYSAPEQLRSEYGDIDRRTDIYQLGVVTYQLLAGRLPFETDRAIDLQEAILESTPEPPSSVVGSVPAALDEPVMRALSKRPADRHDAVVVFRNELREAV